MGLDYGWEKFFSSLGERLREELPTARSKTNPPVWNL
jgi:hypothetical protein